MFKLSKYQAQAPKSETTDEKDRIVNFIESLKKEEITAPLDYEKLAVELNIQNPLVAAMLQHWIKVRNFRLNYCKLATEYTGKLKTELVKLHQLRSEMIKNQSAKESQEEIDFQSDWQEVSDDEEEQYRCCEKPVSRYDVQNMIHFASSVNQMADQATFTYANSISKIKRGMVKICKHTTGRADIATRLINLSYSRSRW